MTCWRRLRDWNEAGVWQRPHEQLLAELNAAGALNWSRAVKGGPKPDRARLSSVRPGSKHHLITDGHGIPRQVSLTGGNRHGYTGHVFADRAYDHDMYRKQVQAAGVTPIIARRGTNRSSGPGKYRWVVEQTFVLPHWFRRLRIRWEIRDDIHEAFLRIACAVICY